MRMEQIELGDFLRKPITETSNVQFMEKYEWC